MSPTYISAIVILLAQILPVLGVTIGTEELTTVVSTIITLVTGLVILIRRYQKGDVNVAGFKKLN